MITQSIVFAFLMQIATVDGQVRDARTHVAIPFAKVEISAGQIPIEQQFTDGQGRFHFRYVSSGRYMISVVHSTYESTLVELDVPASTFPVIIELARRKTPAASGAPVISLRTLLVPDRARKNFERARKEAQRQDCRKAI